MKYQLQVTKAEDGSTVYTVRDKNGPIEAFDNRTDAVTMLELLRGN